MNEKLKILFLCTGNSCRSQMAEAITNNLRSENWEAVSAGTKPEDSVHPNVFKVLGEIGIQHTGRSKHVEEFLHKEFDLVVTVCDQAREQCPFWPGAGRKIHLGFEDPAAVQGTGQEILDAFRKVRNQIQNRMLQILDQHQKLLS